MKIYHEDNLPTLMPPSVAAIGFFDGVHRGHQYLIGQVKELASSAGMSSTVITFDFHPRQVLQQSYVPQLLSTPEGKLRLIGETGVDNCVVLHFSKSLAQLSAREFMSEMLVKRLNVRKLLIGYDNRFGHNRLEGFDDYVRYGRELGIEVLQCKPYLPDGVHISSSAIRKLIAQGDVQRANELLGYRYTVAGKVIRGMQEGRQMGFPTANLDVGGITQMLPSKGVYAVIARLMPDGEPLRAMANIGSRPTFNGHDITFEVNILDFKADIYGRILQVSFVQRMRSEHKFDDEESLGRQLRQDRENVLKIITKID